MRGADVSQCESERGKNEHRMMEEWLMVNCQVVKKERGCNLNYCKGWLNPCSFRRPGDPDRQREKERKRTEGRILLQRLSFVQLLLWPNLFSCFPLSHGHISYIICVWNWTWKGRFVVREERGIKRNSRTEGRAMVSSHKSVVLVAVTKRHVVWGQMLPKLPFLTNHLQHFTVSMRFYPNKWLPWALKTIRSTSDAAWRKFWTKNQNFGNRYVN